MGWLNLKQELQSDHIDTRNENEIYYQQSIDYHVDSVVYWIPRATDSGFPDVRSFNLVLHIISIRVISCL